MVVTRDTPHTRHATYAGRDDLLSKYLNLSWRQLPLTAQLTTSRIPAGASPSVHPGVVVSTTSRIQAGASPSVHPGVVAYGHSSSGGGLSLLRRDRQDRDVRAIRKQLERRSILLQQHARRARAGGGRGLARQHREGRPMNRAITLFLRQARGAPNEQGARVLSWGGAGARSARACRCAQRVMSVTSETSETSVPSSGLHAIRVGQTRDLHASTAAVVVSAPLVRRSWRVRECGRAGARASEGGRRGQAKVRGG